MIPVREFTSADELMAHIKATRAKFFPSASKPVVLPANAPLFAVDPRIASAEAEYLEHRKQAARARSKRRMARIMADPELHAAYRARRNAQQQKRREDESFRALLNEKRRLRKAAHRANGDVRGYP